MGMFTTIIDKNKESYQIKCGYDDCETYHVGDIVNWYIDKNNPGCGKLFDGVYDGICCIKRTTYKTNHITKSLKAKYGWIVITNHKVVGVFNKRHSQEKLREQWSVEAWKHEWWSEQAWLEYYIKQAKCELEHAKWLIVRHTNSLNFLKDLRNKQLSAKNIRNEIAQYKQRDLAEIIVAPLINMINYEGFARKIFKVKKLRKEV